MVHQTQQTEWKDKKVWIWNTWVIVNRTRSISMVYIPIECKIHGQDRGTGRMLETNILVLLNPNKLEEIRTDKNVL